MMKMPIILAIALGTAVSAHAQAPEPELEDSYLRWYASFGIAYGGDTLHSGSYSIGTSYDIRAGDAIFLRMGLSYQVKEDIDVQFTVGYETTSTNASNGKVSFTRVPVEVLGFYDAGSQWRLGLGLRYAAGARLSGTGVADSVGTVDYKPSVGRVIEIQYMFDSLRRDKVQYGVSLRMINESFQDKDAGTNYNGNSSSINLFAYF